MITFLILKSLHFTNRRILAITRDIMPFIGITITNTIFKSVIIVCWLSSGPISPREFLIVAEILPIVFAVEVFDSYAKIVTFDQISSKFDYFVISVSVFWLKK